MLVVAAARDGRWYPQQRAGRIRELDPRGLDAYWANIGRNTSYTINAEEILAENFSQLVLGARSSRTPALYEAIDRAAPRG